MKRLIPAIAILMLLFATGTALPCTPDGVEFLQGDLSYSYDQSPCVPPCQPVAIGAPEHWVQYYFDDGSRREWDVQTYYFPCTGETEDIFVPGSERTFCPYGPGHPCHATDPRSID